MKGNVYRHLLKTYGNLPLLWVGISTEIIRTIVQRVIVVIMLAKVATSVAAGDIATAKSYIWFFVITYTSGAVLGAIGELLAIRTTDKRYKNLLLNYYQKLVGKDISFYRDHQTGYLASSFRQHLDGTMALVRLWRGDIIRMFVSLVFPVTVLFILAGWKAGSTAAVIVIIQTSYIMWASHRADKYRKPAQDIYRKLTGEVSDEVTNAIAFKSGGHEVNAQNKVTELADQETRMFWLRHKMTVLFDAPRIIITGLGVGIAYFVSLLSATGSPEAVGTFVLMFTYMFQIMRNTGDLPDLVARHDEHVSRVHPTLEYLGSNYETVLDLKDPQPLVISKGGIQIKDVTFGYKAKDGVSHSHKVFANLNLDIKGGEHVGIVGVSGAGKSTLASLIMRFDDVDAGSISIDGVDIRKVRQSELRRKIAYVPQEPILFHRTIRENIAYFKDDATDEEIIRAAKAAHIHEFVSELPMGYDTIVGERGIKLSGGQKQRVVIARAILKNAPIMIFDEATSALDSESEQIIRSALPDIIGKHTAIVIAHRLSTVARLDRILVMHEGKIVEEGTPAELLVLGGRYHSLWQKQVASTET